MPLKVTNLGTAAPSQSIRHCQREPTGRPRSPWNSHGNQSHWHSIFLGYTLFRGPYPKTTGCGVPCVDSVTWLLGSAVTYTDNNHHLHPVLYTVIRKREEHTSPLGKQRVHLIHFLLLHGSLSAIYENMASSWTPSSVLPINSGALRLKLRVVCALTVANKVLEWSDSQFPQVTFPPNEIPWSHPKPSRRTNAQYVQPVTKGGARVRSPSK